MIACAGEESDSFRKAIGELVPFAPSRADEIQDWEQVKLLIVQVNRLKTWWRPGFLCIGDAAHAMSPVGGVGVNLAVQDAVAAANILAAPLLRGRLERRAPRPGPKATRVADARNPADSARGPEQRDLSGADRREAVQAAAGHAFVVPVSGAGEASGASGRARHQARACAHGRGGISAVASES